MANKIVQGCVVSIPATYFDGRGNEKWSEQQFGDSWNTATVRAVGSCSESFTVVNGAV